MFCLKVPSQNLPGRVEGNHENSPVTIVDGVTKNRMQDRPDTKQECCSLTRDVRFQVTYFVSYLHDLSVLSTSLVIFPLSNLAYLCQEFTDCLPRNPYKYQRILLKHK